MPKLYMIEKGSKIFLEQTTIIFDHLDGMYSYCYVEGEPSKLVHLSASTPLKRVKGGYKIDG